MKRNKLDWSEVPERYTVELKYRSSDDFVYATSDLTKAWPTFTNYYDEFDVMPEKWTITATRCKRYDALLRDDIEAQELQLKKHLDHDAKFIQGLKDNITKTRVTRGDIIFMKEKSEKEAERLKNQVQQEMRLSKDKDTPEDSGGSCNYYTVDVMNPTTPSNNEGENMNDATYTAECNDIIESLDMSYAEANIFKEIWRTAAARTLGKEKQGHTVKRGAEKILFFAKRNAVLNGVES